MGWRCLCLVIQIFAYIFLFYLWICKEFLALILIWYHNMTDNEKVTEYTYHYWYHMPWSYLYIFLTRVCHFRCCSLLFCSFWILISISNAWLLNVDGFTRPTAHEQSCLWTAERVVHSAISAASIVNAWQGIDGQTQLGISTLSLMGTQRVEQELISLVKYYCLQ